MTDDLEARVRRIETVLNLPPIDETSTPAPTERPVKDEALEARMLAAIDAAVERATATIDDPANKTIDRHTRNEVRLLDEPTLAATIMLARAGNDPEFDADLTRWMGPLDPSAIQGRPGVLVQLIRQRIHAQKVRAAHGLAGAR